MVPHGANLLVVFVVGAVTGRSNLAPSLSWIPFCSRVPYPTRKAFELEGHRSMGHDTASAAYSEPYKAHDAKYSYKYGAAEPPLAFAWVHWWNLLWFCRLAPWATVVLGVGVLMYITLSSVTSTLCSACHVMKSAVYGFSYFGAGTVFAQSILTS